MLVDAQAPLSISSVVNDNNNNNNTTIRNNNHFQNPEWATFLATILRMIQSNGGGCVVDNCDA